MKQALAAQICNRKFGYHVEARSGQGGGNVITVMVKRCAGRFRMHHVRHPHVGFLKEYWAGDMAGDQSRQVSCSGYTPEPRHVSCDRSMDEPVAFLHDMPGFQYLTINVY
ncbi:hypothetical protein [Komagataeibacter swingsii]|uniref:hypothetical protein n=1 Tax=Komagataeibacter swingsii TaxID=215220 RepID=UPI0011B4F940|nr:hypothetical protein [Komagataeibacter swingsii]